MATLYKNIVLRTQVKLMFRQFSYRELNSRIKVEAVWGNYFWAKSYCVDTADAEAEMRRK